MKVWTIALATLSLVTAGCGAFDFTPSTRSAQQVDMSDYFAQRLEAGRLHLAGGRPTKAIEAFRQASYNPAFAPEAFNGMAVAYAAMGRQDVARDMFTRAIDLDPTDMRFRRNLAKVDEQIMLARQAAPVVADPVVAKAEPAEPTAAVAIAKPRVQTARPLALKPTKVREVFIRTQPAQPAVTARVAERKIDGAVVRAPIMIGASRAQTAQAPKPIRIELPGARQLAAVTVRKGNAPSGAVRVYLDKP
ncbi:Tetratricopeptide repeat-containing protein [Porphyrobacter sp. LM 6]|nr:Tetratricopeptide repeat-containing protein [Porphyrobacter sp. LM 6]